MRSLRISHSAARGIIGESLTPDFTMRYVNSLGTYFEGGLVAICRDPRFSSPMIYSSAMASLMSCGCKIVDLGICPTPVAQYYIREHDEICGGISITGGHNSAEWNGIIPFRENGTVFDQYDGDEFLDIFHSMRFERKVWNQLGTVSVEASPTKSYLKALLAYLKSSAIESAKFTVVVDGCNGAAGVLAVELLEKLGCKVIKLNCEPTGYFPHDPEPRPRSSFQLRSIINSIGADIGFNISSDGCRLAIVTNDGETASEEYTYALIADYFLENKRANSIVTNISTTKTIDDLAEKYGANIIKTPIGQSAIIDAMMWENGSLGGEGSGCLAVADFQIAYDAFIAMGLILESMAQHHHSSAELLAKLPRYELVKKSITCRSDRQYAAVEAVRQAFSNEPHLNEDDGIRVDWNDCWIHVRAASTEPILRIIGEARTKERANERVDQVLQIIHSII